MTQIGLPEPDAVPPSLDTNMPWTPQKPGSMSTAPTGALFGPAGTEVLAGPYAPRARAAAADLRKEDLVTVPDCGCASFDSYYHGKKPEYYKKFSKAALAYAWHCMSGTMYWGVHLNGLHVLHIHSLTLPLMGPGCRECLRRRRMP
jgi:hypothetical protein